MYNFECVQNHELFFGCPAVCMLYAINVCYFLLAELRLCRRCRYNAGTPPLSLFLPAHSPVSSNLAELVDKGMEGRSVDFLYTICRYIATIHTDIVEKLTRSVEIVSQKNGHYFLNQHYLYKDRLYLLVRQDLLK